MCGSLDLLLPAFYEARPRRYETASNGHRAAFRLPTGADQEAAAPIAASDGPAGARAILDRIVDRVPGERGGGDVPADLADAIAARIAEADPQAGTAAQLEVSRMRCDVLNQSLTPRAHLRSELQHRARSLYREVHTLASAYHWSEADILRLPRRRRQIYLEMAGALAHE